MPSIKTNNAKRVAMIGSHRFVRSRSACHTRQASNKMRKEFPMIMQSGVSPSFSCSLIQRSNPVPHRAAHKRSESIRTPYTGQKPTLRSSSPSTTKHTSLRSRKSANCMVVPQKICASPESKQTLFKRSTAKSRNNTKTKLSSGTTT